MTKTMTWGDLFCGGGGTTTGAMGVEGVQVLWALNHSASAIATHQANHPETIHYQTDILMQDEHELAEVDGIWMSSECTNHSIAKGGKLLDQGSRALPMQLIRFARHCNPKIIIVENVKEFVNWGPLVDGRPDKKRKGESFRQWVDAIQECGYPNYEHRLLNAADFGAYTSRIRYFGIFTAPGIEIRWPEQTHDRAGNNGLQKWMPCKEKLDLDNWGKSIFEKKLCPNTIKRIDAGLRKYGGDPFILSFYGSNGKPHDCAVKDPLPTITTKDRHALVTQAAPLQFICSQYSTDRPEHMSHDLDNPVPTITTSHAHMLITQFLQMSYNSDGKPETQIKDIDSPLPTITNTNKAALVTQFLTSYYGGADTAERAYPIETPIGTITTENRFALITQFLTRHQNSNGHPEYNVQSIEDAISTLTTAEKHALITQTLGDVYFRFITIDEAKVLQGFPEDYKLVGSKAEQLRHIGNSVVPLMAKVLIESNLTGKHKKRKNKPGLETISAG